MTMDSCEKEEGCPITKRTRDKAWTEETQGVKHSQDNAVAEGKALENNDQNCGILGASV